MTKLEFMSRTVVRSLWGCISVDWYYLAFERAFGRILLMWDRPVVEKLGSVWELSPWFVPLEMSKVTLAFAVVCCPNDDSDRRLRWYKLARLISWCNISWCIGGNFNIIRFSSEHSIGTRLSLAMSEFFKFILNRGL
jgi:hypothetical protein